MKLWLVHVTTKNGERVIPVYATTRKNAVRVFQEQWGTFFKDYVIDSVFAHI